MKHEEYFKTLLDELSDLLEKRLEQLDRWKSFEIYAPWDALPRDVEPSRDEYMFHVVWREPKTDKNISHPEVRSYPIWDIYKKIAKTKERLENDRKVYK